MDNDELKLKAAQAPPRQPIDEYSYLMGRSEAHDTCLKSIEEAMFQMAPQYEHGTMMRPEWEHVVTLADTIRTVLRENMRKLKALKE